MRQVISTVNAPKAVGPYSQAVAVGDVLYCSGQIPLDPVTGEMVVGGVRDQTERVLANLRAVLEASSMRVSDVVKATVFMTDLGCFSEMNEVYAAFFSEPFPARSTVQVAALSRGAQVEIEIVAVGGRGI